MTTANHFQHFGLAEGFDLDIKALGKAYRAKQQETHPDRFAHEAINIQRQAVQETALNTERYQTLKSSVQRGSYLLHINGIDFDLSTHTVDDVEMLIEQMNYREQLSEIKGEMDFQKLEDFHASVTEKQLQVTNLLRQLFEGELQANSAEIKATLCELQFFDKLNYECEQVEEHLLMD